MEWGSELCLQEETTGTAKHGGVWGVVGMSGWRTREDVWLMVSGSEARWRVLLGGAMSVWKVESHMCHSAWITLRECPRESPCAANVPTLSADGLGLRSSSAGRRRGMRRCARDGICPAQIAWAGR